MSHTGNIPVPKSPGRRSRILLKSNTNSINSTNGLARGRSRANSISSNPTLTAAFFNKGEDNSGVDNVDSSHHKTKQWFLASPSPVAHNVYKQEDPAAVVEDATPDDQEPLLGGSNVTDLPTATPQVIMIEHNVSGTGVAQGTNTSSHGAASRGLQYPNLPFLSIVLSKLTSVLPEFCCILAEGPSLSSASRACAVLDSTVANYEPPSSPVSSCSGSPRVYRGRARSNSACSYASHASSRSASPVQGRNVLSAAINPLIKLNHWFTAHSDKSRMRAQEKQLSSPGSAVKRSNNSLSSLPSYPFPVPPAPPEPVPEIPPADSALALEGEWEAYVAPFLLLAGAEVLLSDMQNIAPTERRANTFSGHQKNQQAYQESETPSDSSAASNLLSGLFQKCIENLTRLRVEVCDPFLTVSSKKQNITGKMRSDSLTSESSNEYQQQKKHGADDTANCQPANAEMALSLVKSLQQLIAVIHAKCRMMELQVSLFHGDETVDYAQAAVAVTLLLNTVVKATETSPDNAITAAQPIVDSLVQELKAWRYCLESCAALERCQFLETILAMRRWQIHLPDKTVDSRWARWMRRSFQNMLSVLPIYMDRVKAFASPLYNFDTDVLWNKGSSKKQSPAGSDLDAIVVDFLRQQERLGGPPTAVAIVLDAVASCNAHMERGFYFNSTSFEQDKSVSKDGEVRALWPAVYMRSTLHLSTLAVPAMSRNSTRSIASQSSLRIGSTTSLIPGWPSTANTLSNSPRSRGQTGTNSSSQQLQTSLSSNNSAHGSASGINNALTGSRIFEYAPDTGTAKSWPHNDWVALASILDNQDDCPPVKEEQPTPIVIPSLKGIDSSTPIVDPETRPANRWILTADRTEAFTFRHEDHVVEADINRTHSRDDSIAASMDGVVNLFTARASPGRSLNDRMAGRKVAAATTRPKSTFHVAAISDWLTMVVIVKDEEEGHLWHRRRTKCLEDDEIRNFLDEMANKLRVSSRVFSIRLVRSLPRGRLHQLHHSQKHNNEEHLRHNQATHHFEFPFSRDISSMASETDFWNNEYNVDTFLAKVKDVFKLRPLNPFRDSWRSYSYSGGSSPCVTPLSGKRIRYRQHQYLTRKKSSIAESAAVLFLGSELAPVFDD